MGDIKIIRELRHQLHEIPEPAFQEFKTKAMLMEFLGENTSLEIVDRGCWFYAFHRGKSGEAPIAFRADYDAVTGKDGKPGHYCGHDGHASVLAGLAMMISEYQPERSVLLIFQPAEEIGEGAVICRKILKEKGVSEIYGFHNIPGYPRGSLLLLPHTFACASTGLEITIEGTPSHAAYPEAGKNPAEVISRLILDRKEMLAAVSRGLAQATVIGVDMGSSAYGVSAGQGILRMTLRGEYEDEFRKLVSGMIDRADQLAAEEGMTASVRRVEEFPATQNHEACLEKVYQAALSCGMQTIMPEEPFRWSEDFGYYLQTTPGAFVGIGDGIDWPQLHTEKYEFPDEIIENTIRLFYELI